MGIYKRKLKDLQLMDWKVINRKSSYSQLGEDRIIEFYLSPIRHKDSITYMDIGANHPYYLSNTALLDEEFHINKGVLVEPNPKLCKILKRKRKAICENVGVCGNDQKEVELPYYVMNYDTLNTFSKVEVEKNLKNGYKLKKTINIPIININELLNKHFRDLELDVLSVDVEGMDYELVSSIDFEKFNPNVICVETSHMEKEQMDSFLRGKGYELFGCTCENSIYVK